MMVERIFVHLSDKKETKHQKEKKRKKDSVGQTPQDILGGPEETRRKAVAISPIVSGGRPDGSYALLHRWVKKKRK